MSTEQQISNTGEPAAFKPLYEISEVKVYSLHGYLTIGRHSKDVMIVIIFDLRVKGSSNSDAYLPTSTLVNSPNLPEFLHFPIFTTNVYIFIISE